MPKTNTIGKVGFGGACHWCTEAIFQSIDGVTKVEQGWIASTEPNESLSEAVIVHFDKRHIDLSVLIRIHISTHSATSEHRLREKYRSAIYTFTDEQILMAKEILRGLQSTMEEPLITQVLPFKQFKANKEEYQNYYLKHPEAPFCQRYIVPKLKKIAT